MKARLLRKLLNNTSYIISNHEEYIAVGSNLCHDLIRLDKSTLTIRYALDTFREGRKAIKHSELEFIWDKLHELVSSGEIDEIINGKDLIENPLPVFTVKNGELIESVTDEYGWPNTDDNGVCMYNNTHFPTREQAIQYGITEYGAGVRITVNRIEEIEQELSKAKERLARYKNYITYLNSLSEVKEKGE